MKSHWNIEIEYEGEVVNKVPQGLGQFKSQDKYHLFQGFGQFSNGKLHGTAVVWDEWNFRVNTYEYGNRKGFGRRFAITDSHTNVWTVAYEGMYDLAMHGQGRIEIASVDIFEGVFH